VSELDPLILDQGVQKEAAHAAFSGRGIGAQEIASKRYS
jgi:hypothetical protein